MCDLIQSIYLIEFCEKKLGIKRLSYSSDFSILRGKYTEFSELQPSCIRETIVNFSPLKINLHYFVREIITFAEGKVSVCGLSLIDEIRYGRVASSFNLYFHSCTILEARILLAEILFRAKKLYYKKKEVTTSFEQSLMYSEKDNSIIFRTGVIRIYLYLDVFKDRKELLNSLDTSVEKHGFDPVVGYFCTIPAALSLITSVAPLDITDFSPKKLYHCSAKETIIMLMLNGKVKRQTTGEVMGSIPIHNFLGGQLCYIPILKNDLACSHESFQGDPKLKIKLYRPSKKPPPILSFCEGYQRLEIGISNDRYVAFSNCRRQHNLHDDIFRLLCSYWLYVETRDVEESLLRI